VTPPDSAKVAGPREGFGVAAPRGGFVMAMRANLMTTRRPPWVEWLIVSRFGAKGEHLSIARARGSVLAPDLAPELADDVPPIDLTPHETALARLLRFPSGSGVPTFLFVRRKPVSFSVAGDFVPVEGYARLHRLKDGLRLRAEGRCVSGGKRCAWRADAVRVAWLGEFSEGAGARER